MRGLRLHWYVQNTATSACPYWLVQMCCPGSRTSAKEDARAHRDVEMLLLEDLTQRHVQVNLDESANAKKKKKRGRTEEHNKKENNESAGEGPTVGHAPSANISIAKPCPKAWGAWLLRSTTVQFISLESHSHNTFCQPSRRGEGVGKNVQHNSKGLGAATAQSAMLPLGRGPAPTAAALDIRNGGCQPQPHL